MIPPVNTILASIRTPKFVKGFSLLLNELSALSKSLSARGLKPVDFHPWIDEIRKGEALVAEIDAAGQLARVSYMNSDQVVGLLNIRKNNSNSFPAFNLNCPLLEEPPKELWNQPEGLWQFALSSTEASPLALENSQPKRYKDRMKRLSNLLTSFPATIPPLLGGETQILRSTTALLRRLALGQLEPKSFIRKIADQVIALEQSGHLSKEKVIAILYGNLSSKKRDWQVSVILDVNDLDNFQYRVADSTVAMEWNRCLVGARDRDDGGGTGFRCSLSGNPDKPMSGLFPGMKLPGLGKTVLLSMNKDAPCQMRYGKIGTDIFRAGSHTVKGLFNALKSLTQKSQHGKTWAEVPSGSKLKTKRDLLIAYLEDEPRADTKVASFFADEADSELEMATFELRTQSVYDALRIQNNVETDRYITLLALSRVDDRGRRQVSYNARYTTKSILKSRENWVVGAKNVPTVLVPISESKGKSESFYSGYQPSPIEVLKSSKLQWLESGQRTYPVHACIDLGTVYTLFLEPIAVRQAANLLNRYLQLTQQLVIGFARWLPHRAYLLREKEGGFPMLARKELLVAIAIYGILLHRQGRRKEDYMRNRDFMIGQFLQFADLIHKQYCIDVRSNGDSTKDKKDNPIPPQLIGNALIPMALQSPGRAFCVLSQRLPIYLAWAERYNGENVGLVKWAHNNLRGLSSQLADSDMVCGASTNGKAELLLGYLAREEKEKTN